MVTNREKAETALLPEPLCNKMAATAIADEKVQKTDQLSYLFLIFLTGCLVGWIYEEFFYWVTEGLLRNRGILYGPWLPIYGIGALGIYAMKPMKKKKKGLFGRKRSEDDFFEGEDNYSDSTDDDFIE